MKSHIPISNNPENWWQKSRILYLNYFLKYLNKKYDLNILEIGPGFGINVETLSQYGIVDIVETEKHFLKHLKEEKSDNIKNFYDDLYKIPNNKYDFIVLMDVLEHIPGESRKICTNNFVR